MWWGQFQITEFISDFSCSFGYTAVFLVRLLPLNNSLFPAQKSVCHVTITYDWPAVWLTTVTALASV